MTKILGLPVGLIYRWRSLHPDFEQKLSLAREDRAEYYRDEFEDTLSLGENIDKDDVAGKKMQLDGLKWLCEKDAPKRYGPKKADSAGGTGGAGTIIVIDTGINRPALEVESVEAECEVLDGRETEEAAEEIAVYSRGADEVQWESEESSEVPRD